MTEQPSISRFRRFAFLTTAATYLLIFMGGLVRVSGAGLGCPDWPKCFGRWIPPTDISQLPPDIDPSRFNFTLAWIEYINRLIGVSVGFLVLLTALWALLKFRRTPGIVYPAVAAVLLVAFEGWQGAVVVASALKPIVVTVHMLLALIVVSLLVFTTLQAYYLEKPREINLRFPRKLALWTVVLWVVALVQVVLGTQMRSALEVLTRQFPLMSTLERLLKLGRLNDIHIGLGVALAAVTWIVGIRLIRETKHLSPLVKQATVAAIVLVTAQIALGVGFWVFGVPPVMQVFHLWVASLYIGCLLVLLATAMRRDDIVGKEEVT
jgi:cytochrome c oxidase assembly protein subunit 15